MDSINRIKYKVKLRVEIDYTVFIAAESQLDAVKKARDLDLIEIENNHFHKDFRESNPIEVNDDPYFWRNK